VKKSSLNICYLSSILFVCSIGSKVFSQQLPIYSQYHMNAFLLNPANAGHEGYTSINLTVREQWVGLKDAPSTVALSAQTRMLKNSFIARSKSIRKRRKAMSRSGKVGYGIYIFNDQNGAFRRTGLQLAYSYHIALRRSQLSFGLSLNTFQYAIDPDKVRLEYLTSDEQKLITNDSKYITDGNFGAYYSDKNIYAGFSVLNLFESNFKFGNREGADFRMERNYLLMAGYRFDLVDYVFIEPSFLFKFSENVVIQNDLACRLFYKDEYWGGIAYRTGSGSRVSSESVSGRGSSLIFMLGAKVQKFNIGYSFDYTFSSISKNTYGSHEIILAVKFGDNARRYRWLNRY
jgi:type IX secretion system PorP/SprF family membrane protein